MIHNTFIFLDGISDRWERRLWQSGINTWNDFLDADNIPGISRERKHYYDMRIRQAKEEPHRAMLGLAPVEHWRAYDYYKDECLYIDLETSSVDGYITCLSLYDGIDVKTMVKNINLDMRVLAGIVNRHKMIVTFNGSVFDEPFLRKRVSFKELLHFDLRFGCNRIGLCGGLKTIESKLGIVRKNNIVRNIHSGDPIKLWRMYLASGDKYYLDLLVEYNQEDVLNLPRIAGKVYSKLIRLPQVCDI